MPRTGHEHKEMTTIWLKTGAFGAERQGYGAICTSSRF
jgi:hypothetical protein